MVIRISYIFTYRYGYLEKEMIDEFDKNENCDIERLINLLDGFNIKWCEECYREEELLICVNDLNSIFVFDKNNKFIRVDKL